MSLNENRDAITKKYNETRVNIHDHTSHLIQQHLYQLQIFSTCVSIIITSCQKLHHFPVSFTCVSHQLPHFNSHWHGILKRFQTICIYPCRHSRSPLQGRPWSWETDRRAAVSGVPWIAAGNEDRGKTTRSGLKFPSVWFDYRAIRQVPSPALSLCECLWVCSSQRESALSAALQLQLRHWLTGEAGLQSCSC